MTRPYEIDFMTEPHLHGERFQVRYVELGEALSWLLDTFDT